jgi:class 3 adenylate cyclase/transcriptional regulator with GAF, ATPase, and Fis domain
MSESIFTESDNLFQLKTLYEVSKELFEAKDYDTVLQNFLMTIIGSLGVLRGSIALHDNQSGDITHFINRGIDEEDQIALRRACAEFLRENPFQDKNGASFLVNSGKFPQNIKALIPFGLDKDSSGILVLGDKLISGLYREQDIDLLLTLINHLIVALKNSQFRQQMEKLNQDLKRKNIDLENAFEELDRRVYHLKTLNDISRDIFSTVEFDAIINHFMLMIMGNFGVMQGFAMMTTMDSDKISFFKSMGYDDEDNEFLKKGAKQIIRHASSDDIVNGQSILVSAKELAPHDICALSFQVTDTTYGFMGLGPKLIGEPFNEDDQELMMTLVNSLVVSLKNALSFENIKQLNLDLQEKNIQLKKTLKELKAALRKVELLESIKSNLSKFVPTAVTKLVENASSSEIHEAREQDISVLFLDIEGYTKITDEIGATNVNTLIERYFSVFMDAIYANDGDVVETAGDGLMVLFMSSDEEENALQAVRAAQTVIEKACAINDECTLESERCLVNVGVSSGKAFVGAAKFDSIIGSRWTYTTHGTIVNIAARLCSQAKGGEALVSEETAKRVKGMFQFNSLGRFSLKNLAEKVEVFALV